jgi:hypothetical protein
MKAQIKRMRDKSKRRALYIKIVISGNNLT